MELTLKFDLTVEGDTLTGTSQPSLLLFSRKVSGSRSSARWVIVVSGPGDMPLILDESRLQFEVTNCDDRMDPS